MADLISLTAIPGIVEVGGVVITILSILYSTFEFYIKIIVAVIINFVHAIRMFIQDTSHKIHIDASNCPSEESADTLSLTQKINKSNEQQTNTLKADFVPNNILKDLFTFIKPSLIALFFLFFVVLVW
jgi:hypothetical protein